MGSTSGGGGGGSAGSGVKAGARVWSTREVPRVLGRYSGITASTWTTVYTAPDKVRGVVEFLNVSGTSSKTITVKFRIVDGLSANITLFQGILNGAGESIQFLEYGDKLVIESGWSLQIYADQTNIDYIASGYEEREDQ